MTLFLHRVLEPLYEWFVMILFFRFVQIHLWFPQVTATWHNVSSTYIGNRHWIFRAALIFSFLYYLQKTKKLFIERWIAVSSMKS